MKRKSLSLVVGGLLIVGACLWFANELRAVAAAFNEFGEFEEVVDGSLSAGLEQKGGLSKEMISEYRDALNLRVAISSSLFALALGGGLWLVALGRVHEK